MLINAVKELNADKEEQQVENQALRSRLDNLEQLFKELTKWLSNSLTRT